MQWARTAPGRGKRGVRSLSWVAERRRRTGESTADYTAGLVVLV